MEQVLSNVTGLDLGQVIAMPFCTMLLADMGAGVIKVECLEQARERRLLGMKRMRTNWRSGARPELSKRGDERWPRRP